MVFRLPMLSKGGIQIQSLLYTRQFFEYSVFGIRIIMRMPCPALPCLGANFGHPIKHSKSSFLDTTS